MHLSTILSTTALVAVASAAPTTGAAPLAPRSCSVAFPSTIVSLDQKAPTTASGKTLKIRTSQDQGGNGREAMEIAFTDIPANAYGCQLELYLPAGTAVTNSGSSQVNTYLLNGDISAQDTWMKAPAKGSLFGTTNVYADPKQPTKIVVNSLQCKPKLNFRVEIASQTEWGVMAFAQQNPPSTQPVGYRMTYNC
ncbi:hypothetical protein BS50DRAFT_638775 [Corynespora cassiicola Philippines]|uniref:Ubiquitin 3 binding protein But2 C-terminal domain-containing protein n=1 Tax=Corynespora cassiicola Philippines TaxID=1448308 RepID=A0A2T2N9W7_CORCC|nr:hypothetical protein BS50DRAFT_638775 [Corynespora cassiicola Philippines]